MEYGQWASSQGLQVTIQTYSNYSIGSREFGFQLKTVPRAQSILTRYLRMILAIGINGGKCNYVLSVGAFLETYFASRIFGFTYVAKVPGDIVWERARNNGVTKAQIEEFQDEKLRLKYRVFRNLYTKSLKKARIVIVPSMGIYNLCAKWGVSESKLRLIYNSASPLTKLMEVSADKKFDLITVCRLAPWKGVDELIEYAAGKNLSLLVLGDGPEKYRLELLANSLNAKVTFAGEVDTSEVQNSLAQSKLFVLNSYYEGLPHALVEARLAGILSVGRAGTGSEEVIHDDIDGFLIRRDRSLSQTIDTALATLQDSQIMTSRAKVDSLHRFSKVNNFPSILNELQGP